MTDLRTLENDSIRAFVQSAADEGYLSGRVLDYGAGRMPYRDIVEAAGGEYHAFDRSSYPGNTSGDDIGADLLLSHRLQVWDAVLSTQTVQYQTFDRLRSFLTWAKTALSLHEQEGHLVLTYPTNWPEVEHEDLHRFTKAGMERLLTEAGFTIVRHERRATAIMAVSDYESRNERVALGYGVICRA